MKNCFTRIICTEKRRISHYYSEENLQNCSVLFKKLYENVIAIKVAICAAYGQGLKPY